MNIASIYKDTPTSQNIYNEILPYYVSTANSTSNAYLKYLFGRKSDTETSIYSIKPAPNQGALQAVKSDPAVLEARITIATRNDGHTSLRRRNDDTQLVRTKGTETPALPTSFEELISKQQAALLSLTSQQVELLMKYVDTLRRQRTSHQINLECAFCKNNGEPLAWYTSHALKTWRGRVQCPVLRAYRCPRCGATGDRAHTIKYCPANMDSDFWSRTNSP